MPAQTKYDFVFVYGTLKKGEGANELFLADSHFVGPAETPPIFRMWGLNAPYPMLTESKEGKSVWGEVYQVTEPVFERLDQYEGFPAFYSRKRVPVRPLDKSFVLNDDVWVYFVRPNTVPVQLREVKPNKYDALVWHMHTPELDDDIPF